MKKRYVIIAVAAITALSLIVTGLVVSNKNKEIDYNKNTKNKAEVVEQYKVKEKQAKTEKKQVKEKKVKNVDEQIEENKSQPSEGQVNVQPVKKIDEQKETEKKKKPSQPVKHKDTEKKNSIKASSQLFYPKKHIINHPDREVFDKYYDYALDVYNYAIKGNPVGELTFDTKDEMKLFIEQIKETVLNDSGVPDLENFKLSYTANLAESSKMKPTNTGHNEFKELQEIETFIIKKFGNNGIKDLTLIENINRWLKNNTSYDYDYKDISYTELGIVRNRSEVCNGYSLFVNKVCDMYGVPCERVVGHGKTSNLHAWNRVKIGGTWYYIDTTWNVCRNSDEYYLSKKLWDDHSL